MSQLDWRGILAQPLDPDVAEYISSLSLDRKIALIDLGVYQAYALMLLRSGILNQQELAQILNALESAKHDWAEGKLSPQPGDVDIHPIFERYVCQRVPEAGPKLYSGKSRNDQIATDLKIHARSQLIRIARELLGLIKDLLELSSKHLLAPLVMHTHHQPAQLTSWGHYFLSYGFLLARSLDFLIKIYDQLNLCPLGSGVLAGSRIGIDREYLAQLLGFDGVQENTLDSVSSRDWMLRLCSELCICLDELSRLAQDLIIWSSREFGYLKLSDQVCDSSSAMPHKRNPVALEILRANAGYCIGELNSMLNILRGIPTGYCLDLQQLKLGLFRILELFLDSISVLRKVLAQLEIQPSKIWEAAWDVLPYELAEELAIKGVPYRRAYTIVAQILGRGTQLRDLHGLSSELLKYGVEIQPQRLLPQSWLEFRSVRGSPNPEYVRSGISKLDSRLEQLEQELNARSAKLEKARSQLNSEILKHLRSAT